jgi:hypothetical protein
MASTNTIEKDIFGKNFQVGTVVSVRCIVTSITPANQGFGGSGDSVLLTVETNGNAGEKAGVTFTVSPVQCRFSGSSYQL